MKASSKLKVFLIIFFIAIFAIIGQNAANSEVKHTKLEYGSGGKVNNYLFTGMFSIHNTKNINPFGKKTIFHHQYKNNGSIYYYDSGGTNLHMFDVNVCEDDHNTSSQVTIKVQGKTPEGADSIQFNLNSCLLYTSDAADE